MQTSYDNKPSQWLPGQATTSEVTNTLSFVAEENIPFAYGVVAGTTQNDCKLPTVDTDRFLGIARHTHITTDYYEATDMANIATKGPFAVRLAPAVSVSAGEPAYLSAAADFGTFTNVALNNIATGGKFRLDAAAGALAELEINLP